MIIVTKNIEIKFKAQRAEEEVKMEPVYVYPGTFSPPTYGHKHIVDKAVELIDRLTIICSVNPNKKDQWFSPEECKKLWEHYLYWQYYNDPLHYPDPSVKVETLASFLKQKIDPSEIIMIRGIREVEDLEEEKKVVLLNKIQFKIDKFLYLFCDDKYKNISSTKVRELISAGEFSKAEKMVSGEVFFSLLKKTEERRKKNGRSVCQDSTGTSDGRLSAPE